MVTKTKSKLNIIQANSNVQKERNIIKIKSGVNRLVTYEEIRESKKDITRKYTGHRSEVKREQ